MAESAHRTYAPSEPSRIPYAPSQAESVVHVALHSAILTACDKLAAATEEYAAASGLLAGALGRDAEARLNLEYIEADARARLYRDGVPGANEAARQAILATLLADDPDVDDARQARDTAHGDRLTAEHHFRVCDQAQKSLRARLDALSALVRA